MDLLSECFEHNYYLSAEFANFCARVSGVPLRHADILGNSLPLLKKKNIAIANYSDSIKEQFRHRGISYASVLNKINRDSSEATLMEYPIFHATSYEQAQAGYSTSFFHGLREGKKYPHEFKIMRKPEADLLRRIHQIYAQQMRRHHSFILPLSFFQEYFRNPSAVLFLIECQQKIIAYLCCFQYSNNLYSSIGGGDPRSFALKPSHKLYDELIHYACSHNLNIHLGIGEHEAGYQRFKEGLGAINYQLERFPNDRTIMKITFFLIKFRITGYFLAIISKFFPHQIAYQIMPFT